MLLNNSKELYRNKYLKYKSKYNKIQEGGTIGNLINKINE